MKHYHEYLRNKKKCKVNRCHKNARIYHFCQRHFKEFREDCLCKVENCDKFLFKENMCKQHFSKGKCLYKNCENKEIYCFKKLLCKLHYNQEYRKGKKENLIGNRFPILPTGQILIDMEGIHKSLQKNKPP